MKKLIQCLFRLIPLILILATFTAKAALDLELTQGIKGAIPIAVVPFAGQEDSLSAPNNIASVIAADLNNSGRFKVADFNSLQQMPHEAQNLDYSYWQKRNLSDLVVGKVTAVGGGRYQVSFQLINPYNNQSSVILSDQFNVNQNSLRALAHHISDLVYQQLTGDRGIFSTKIAYVLVKQNGNAKRYYLEVADQDGYNPKALMSSSEPIMSPAWSPNGKSLAYVSFEGGNAAIYVQDVATGARRLISHFPDGNSSAPAWSPDGKKIALVMTKTGYSKIYIMNLVSGALTQLTNGYSLDTEPSWSPDGQSIIFTSDRGGNPQIYQINLASKQIQRLTFSGPYNARSAFTSSGSAIVMLTQSGNGYDAAIQDLQTGRTTLLTNLGDVQSPTIAPNGKMLAYAESNGGVLGMVSTDGKVKLRLPAGDGAVQEPAWSPFLNS